MLSAVKIKKHIGILFAFALFAVCFSFNTQAAMSVNDAKTRLSAYSDYFIGSSDGTLNMEFSEWDLSEEEIYYIISDMTESLMGEPVEDYCQVHIKFYYTHKLYGSNFESFRENILEVKKKLSNFWTDWSRYNNLGISITSYNNDEHFSLNITLQLNGSISDTKGEKYNEKLLSIINEAQGSSGSDMETVQYFLKWLDENVAYRYYTGFTNDPYYALISGKTVCGGYANAFKDLCNAVGIPAIVPVNQELNHAWSQVYVDGTWYTADLCDVVHSKSNTYNGYLFTDPDVPLDCSSFVEKHKSEYVNAFKYRKATNIGACTFSYDNSKNYTGSAIRPTVKITYGGKILKEGTHYNLRYSSNSLPGTAKITVEGIKKNGYKGIRTLEFKISVPKPTVTVKAGKTTAELKWKKVDKAAGYIVRLYNSKTKKFEDLAKVTGTSCTVKDLLPGRKYVFAVRSYVKASGDTYKSEQTKFTVITIPDKVKGLKISSVKANSLKLKWTEAENAQKYEIYISTDGKKWEKKATTKKTSCTVKSLKANKKYYFKVRAVNSSGKGSFSGKKSTVTLLSAPEIKLTAGDGQLSVKWNKISKANGYVVCYSTKKNMSNSKKITVKKRKNVKAVIKELKNNKKYYVRVRAYKTVDGKRVYGQYSAVSALKTK